MGEPQAFPHASLNQVDQSLRGREKGKQTLEYLPWVVFLTTIID